MPAFNVVGYLISRPRRAARRARPFRYWIACGIVAIYALVALLAPYLTTVRTAHTDVLNRTRPPFSHSDGGHVLLLGTDQLGRPMLGDIILGTRISVTVGVTTVLVAVLFGTVLGLIAGYVGGWVDSASMRLVDLQLAFPSIILAIFIAGALGPSEKNVIISLALASWVVFARVTRAQTLATKPLAHVEASRVLGAHISHILRRAILPSCRSVIAIYATVQFGFVVVSEAALSFLGVGIPASQTSWGSTIASGRDYLGSAWWIATLPGLALALLVVSISVVGDELARGARD